MIIQVAWMFNDTQKIGGPTLQEKGQLVQRSKDDEQVQLGPNLPGSKADERRENDTGKGNTSWAHV